MTTLYKKVGRRYKPVAEHEEWDSYPAGAHLVLARSINEDEPVTENARAVTMRMVIRLRDVLMAINNAAPEAKP